MNTPDTETTQPNKAAFKIPTPLGMIEVTGSSMTLNTLMTLAILAIMSLTGAWVWKHKDEMEAGRAQTNVILQNHEESQKKMISAIKENTCILSLPPEKREAEFSSPNSLCKRMTQ